MVSGLCTLDIMAVAALWSRQPRIREVSKFQKLSFRTVPTRRAAVHHRCRLPAGVDAQVGAERPLEPVGALHGKQGGHLRGGRRLGFLGRSADPPQPHQHVGHHRERRRDLAQCLQPHRHQRVTQVSTSTASGRA